MKSAKLNEHSCYMKQPAHSKLLLPLLLFALQAAFILPGCQSRLVPAPNLYAYSTTGPFSEVVPEHRNNVVKVLYVTDRNPEVTGRGGVIYGHRRSKSLAFGVCTVEFGQGISWDRLVGESLKKKGMLRLPVLIKQVEELERFPDTPWPLEVVKGKLVEKPQVLKEHAGKESLFCSELSKLLSATPRKEAYVYIHGFNTRFEGAVTVIAQLWHFLSREGVPILYTWPAGAGGLRGYPYDRESGEFTIHHLKQFIRMLASCPGLEKIHIVAHSRGTDVATSALRELFIEAKAAGLNPKEEYRIKNIVLAAPDLDMEVVSQRLVSDRFFNGAERITVYISPTDKAIGFADWLFASMRRIGQLHKEDLPAKAKKFLRKKNRIQLIDARVSSGFLGHSYFYSNPAVLSDLILLLRDNLDPGADNGRPLIAKGNNFWELSDDYPSFSEGR